MDRAAIGVRQPSGLILAATVMRGEDLGDILAKHYATRLRATMLTTLGAIDEVGDTPARCRIANDGGEPTLVTEAAFERQASEGFTHFHIHQNGGWTSWAEAPVSILHIGIED